MCWSVGPNSLFMPRGQKGWIRGCPEILSSLSSYYFISPEMWKIFIFNVKRCEKYSHHFLHFTLPVLMVLMNQFLSCWNHLRFSSFLVPFFLIINLISTFIFWIIPFDFSLPSRSSSICVLKTKIFLCEGESFTHRNIFTDLDRNISDKMEKINFPGPQNSIIE